MIAELYKEPLPSPIVGTLKLDKAFESGERKTTLNADDVTQNHEESIMKNKCDRGLDREPDLA